eukprot:15067556-Alexandrium_andersonii.AAC.1
MYDWPDTWILGPPPLICRLSDRLDVPTDGRWKMQNRTRHLKLTLHGPGKDLKVGPRSSPG